MEARQGVVVHCIEPASGQLQVELPYGEVEVGPRPSLSQREVHKEIHDVVLRVVHDHGDLRAQGVRNVVVFHKLQTRGDPKPNSHTARCTHTGLVYTGAAAKTTGRSVQTQVGGFTWVPQ
jgi:hypothetical protein